RRGRVVADARGHRGVPAAQSRLAATPGTRRTGAAQRPAAPAPADPESGRVSVAVATRVQAPPDQAGPPGSPAGTRAVAWKVGGEGGSGVDEFAFAGRFGGGE